VSGLAYDFTIIEIPAVDKAARDAARNVAAKYETVYLDSDDLYQEAVMLLAAGSERVRIHLANEAPGFIYKELSQRLYNKVETELGRSNKQLSREAILDGFKS
jgi:hypothetical protein